MKIIQIQYSDSVNVNNYLQNQDGASNNANNLNTITSMTNILFLVNNKFSKRKNNVIIVVAMAFLSHQKHIFLFKKHYFFSFQSQKNLQNLLYNVKRSEHITNQKWVLMNTHAPPLKHSQKLTIRHCTKPTLRSFHSTTEGNSEV